MKKKKSISVVFNQEGIPYIPIKKNTRLTFEISENSKSIKITGNKKGLKLMSKALLGVDETKRTDGFHINLDDLHDINEENKKFIIDKQKE